MNFFKRLFVSRKISLLPINIEEGSRKIPIIPPSISEPIDTQDQPLSEEEITERINMLANDYYESQSDLYSINFDANSRDPLFEDAAKLIVQSQSGSTSLLQRRMKLGYNRTGRLMDQLEAAGIVGPNQGSKVRDVLIKTEEDLNHLINNDILSFARNTERMKMKLFFDDHREEIEKRIQELHNESENEKRNQEKEKIRVALLEKERKKSLQKQTLQELKDEGLIKNKFKERRQPIPQDVMDSVWNRDGGKCVKCGSKTNLEFDHIIPFSKGGSNTYRNLQLLCEKCNNEKSNKIG